MCIISWTLRPGRFRAKVRTPSTSNTRGLNGWRRPSHDGRRPLLRKTVPWWEQRRGQVSCNLLWKEAGVEITRPRRNNAPSKQAFSCCQKAATWGSLAPLLQARPRPFLQAPMKCFGWSGWIPKNRPRIGSNSNVGRTKSRPTRPTPLSQAASTCCSKSPKGLPKRTSRLCCRSQQHC